MSSSDRTSSKYVQSYSCAQYNFTSLNAYTLHIPFVQSRICFQSITMSRVWDKFLDTKMIFLQCIISNRKRVYLHLVGKQPTGYYIYRDIYIDISEIYISMIILTIDNHPQYIGG